MDHLKLNLQKALEISRNFGRRTDEDEQYLYDCIQIAVSIAQDDFNEYNRMAMDFIVKIYSPFIRKIAKNIFRSMSRNNNLRELKFSFDDVLQETYFTFFVLLRQYDAQIASFSYYINQTLPKRMKYWLSKEIKKVSCDMLSDSDCFVDPKFSSSAYAESYFNSLILIKDYLLFMQEREKNTLPGSTAAMVCADYFLGRKSCSEIAKERKVSYHAVYDMINKYKRYVIQFFNTHPFFDGILTSTGEIVCL